MKIDRFLKFLLWKSKSEEQGAQTLVMRDKLMTLYAKEFLLEFLNKDQQLLLQENKESEDKRAKDVNQTHPNQHADPIESISESDYIRRTAHSGGDRNLKLMKD